MAHVELLNDNSRDLSERILLETYCKRDLCTPEDGHGTHTLGAPIAEEEQIGQPIKPCFWP